MFVTIVHVRVKPESVDSFIEACRKNHEAAVREPENRRFDVLQDAGDPCKFILYEAYATKAGAAAHKESAHYLIWRDSVAGMMASNRKGVVHTGLFPAN